MAKKHTKNTQLPAVETDFLLMVIIGIAGFVLLGVAGYLIRKPIPASNKMRMSSLVVLKADECKDNKDVIALVDNFEKAQKSRNGDEVFKLFTNPGDANEIVDYQKLVVTTPTPKNDLYATATTNYNLNSYAIKYGPVNQGSAWCEVIVEENRSTYNPTTKRYAVGAKGEYVILIGKETDTWKIDQYNSTDPKHKRGKYGGFLLELAN